MYEPTTEEEQFLYYTTILNYVIYTSAMILYIFWLFRIAINIRSLIRGYKRNEREDCNIYKTRKYNYDTAIGRNILMISIGGAEIGYVVLIYSYVIFFYLRHKHNPDKVVIASNCTISNWLASSYEHQELLVWYGFVNLGVIMCVMLISLTTSFLKYRYLNLTVRKLFVKFAISFSVQSVIILACSTIYTFILLLMIGPFLILTNIIMLIRISRDFSRFLIFNNRSVFFQYRNAAVFKTQERTVA